MDPRMSLRKIGLIAISASATFLIAAKEVQQQQPARPRPDAIFATYPGTGVMKLPDSVRARFNLDTTFYAKFADASGIAVIASAKVPDEALLVTRDIMIHMLSKRPDLRANIIQRNGRVGVMAITEMTTDIPEQREWKKPALTDRRLTDGERARYDQPGGIGS